MLAALAPLYFQSLLFVGGYAIKAGETPELIATIFAAAPIAMVFIAAIAFVLIALGQRQRRRLGR